jgi:hypothetical protein
MWPVIFVLDGNMHFNMVVDMVRFMNIRVEFCNELPDALIVGIGYPVTGTLTDMLYHVMHLRMRTSSSVAKRVAKPSCRTTSDRRADTVRQRPRLHAVSSPRTHPVDRDRLPGRPRRPDPSRSLDGGKLRALHALPPPGEGISQQDLAGPKSLVDRLTTRRYDGLRITHENIVGTHCAMVPFAYQSGLEQVFSN